MQLTAEGSTELRYYIYIVYQYYILSCFGLNSVHHYGRGAKSMT
jgi:hypothetical protein